MKVLINLYNLTSGGGLTIGRGFLEEIIENHVDIVRSGWEFHVLLPPNCLEYDRIRTDISSMENMNCLSLSPRFYSRPGRLFIEKEIARRVEQMNLNAVINLTNYPIPTSVFQVSLIHWPYLVYYESELWTNMTWLRKQKRKFSRRRILQSIHYANKLVVQTGVMQKRLLATLKEYHLVMDPTNIVVIPGFHNFSTPLSEKVKKDVKKHKQLIFVSNFYEHKNHEILIPLAREIEKRNLNIEIHMTIRNDLNIVTEFQKHPAVLKNLGPLSQQQLEEIYPKYDGLFFPTLVETFGIPYVEAMHFGLPVYTSDRDFAHAVCGTNAIYFDPNDAKDIADKLENGEIQKAAEVQNKQWNRKSVVNAYLELLKSKFQ